MDPELLALPAPPSGRRVATMFLMAFVVVTSLALVGLVRHDVAYFFAPSGTIDLGDVGAVDPAHLDGNTHVRLTGTPTAASSVRYQRVMTGESYEVFPLAGQRLVFVHVPASAAASGRTEFTGRLVTFGQLGSRMRAVRGFLEGEMGMPVTAESFVLLVDESPGTYYWALGLVLFCVAVILLDLVLILRWFRPIRDGGTDAGAGDGDDETAAAR